MLIFHIHVDAPEVAAQAVKEHLAMELGRFGDVREPERMRMPGMAPGGYEPQRRR